MNFGVLHQIIQSWILTFPDMATLDAQFDEAKIVPLYREMYERIIAGENYGSILRPPAGPLLP